MASLLGAYHSAPNVLSPPNNVRSARRSAVMSSCGHVFALSALPFLGDGNYFYRHAPLRAYQKQKLPSPVMDCKLCKSFANVCSRHGCRNRGNLSRSTIHRCHALSGRFWDPFGVKLSLRRNFSGNSKNIRLYVKGQAGNRGNSHQSKTDSLGGRSRIGTQRISEENRWRGALILVGRTLALCSATICITWIAGAVGVQAAGDGTAVLPLVADKAVALKGTFLPKLFQVLAVVKDQGLLLSALLGISAFFSMAETSIMTLWPWKVRELAEKEGEGGVFSLLQQDVTRFLTTILIGTTVVNIAATALVTDAATALFGEAGVTAATGVMTVLILLATEIAPKSIAVHNATQVARFAVRPVAWLSVILYPVGRVVTALSMALLKVLGLKSSGEPFVSEEELKLMLRGAELSGAIEEEEQDMIENVLEIKDTYVREVMTPLVDVVAIDAAASLMQFRNLWVKHQYSRIPVFERRVDNIVGIAYAMDMLDYVDYDAEQVEVLKRLTVGRIAHRPAYFVPDSMSVWNLLREFRIRKVHMAIVLNEYGGTVGVVTLEDVVEEIVGEIFDENDSKEEIRKKTGYVVQRADGVFDVDANTHIEDLSEALEVKMPEGPYRYETVSGFVCEAFGYIPRTGDSINLTLRKADAEDNQDRRDGEADIQEKREKIQKFRLEILAGNARKVGAVRFEKVDGSQVREDGVEFPRGSRVFSNKGWDEAEGREEAVLRTNENCEISSDSDEDDLCVDQSEKDLPDYPLESRYLIAETVNVDCETEDRSPRSAATILCSEDWELVSNDRNVDEPSVIHTESDDEEKNSCVKGPVNERWVEQERQVERRIQRRKKQSAEAAVELDRQRRADLRRREAELATTAMKNGRDEHGESGNFHEMSS
ncbi:hypothetical protein R1sor_013620 [Riccia sorocarpa]|uniref:Uncharacterized protein n=1 Tax=Riccia sorocarpa TaxID=122646 RepID=A0ABD3HB76_9MARC